MKRIKKMYRLLKPTPPRIVRVRVGRVTVKTAKEVINSGREATVT
jgi:hypothetical protein